MYFCVLCCDKASSTSANELSRQWAVRFSTAHRLEIRRALYLMPSRNKMLALKMLTHFSLYIYNPPKSSFEKEDFKADAK